MSIATVNARASAACARVASRRADVPRSAPVDIFGTRRPISRVRRTPRVRRLSRRRHRLRRRRERRVGGSPRVLRRRGRPPTPPRPRHAPRVFRVGPGPRRLAEPVRHERDPRGRHLRPRAPFLPTAGCEAGFQHRRDRLRTHRTARRHRPRPRGRRSRADRTGRDPSAPIPLAAEHRLGFDDPADAERFEPTRARSRATDVTPERRRRRGVRAGRHRRVEGVLLRTVQQRRFAVLAVRGAEQMGRVPGEGQGRIHGRRVDR